MRGLVKHRIYAKSPAQHILLAIVEFTLGYSSASLEESASEDEDHSVECPNIGDACDKFLRLNEVDFEEIHRLAEKPNTRYVFFLQHKSGCGIQVHDYLKALRQTAKQRQGPPRRSFSFKKIGQQLGSFVERVRPRLSSSSAVVNLEPYLDGVNTRQAMNKTPLPTRKILLSRHVMFESFLKSIAQAFASLDRKPHQSDILNYPLKADLRKDIASSIILGLIDPYVPSYGVLTLLIDSYVHSADKKLYNPKSGIAKVIESFEFWLNRVAPNLYSNAEDFRTDLALHIYNIVFGKDQAHKCRPKTRSELQCLMALTGHSCVFQSGVKWNSFVTQLFDREGEMQFDLVVEEQLGTEPGKNRTPLDHERHPEEETDVKNPSESKFDFLHHTLPKLLVAADSHVLIYNNEVYDLQSDRFIDFWELSGKADPIRPKLERAVHLADLPVLIRYLNSVKHWLLPCMTSGELDISPKFELTRINHMLTQQERPERPQAKIDVGKIKLSLWKRGLDRLFDILAESGSVGLLKWLKSEYLTDERQIDEFRLHMINILKAHKSQKLRDLVAADLKSTESVRRICAKPPSLKFLNYVTESGLQYEIKSNNTRVIIGPTESD